MIVNLIVITLILLIALFYSKGSKLIINGDNNRKKYIVSICVILILQSGLRNVAVGEDTYNYFLMFQDVKSTSWKDIYGLILDYYRLGFGKDPGYLVFQKIIQILSGEFQIYLIIVAIIFFSALGNFVLKNTKSLGDAMMAFIIYSVLFYSFYSFTGIRQTLATAATLYSYELIKKKKLIPFLILIFLASTIHKSALIFVPFYFIAHIKNIKIFYRSILFLFPIFMIFKVPIANYLKLIGGYEEYEQYKGAGTFTFTAFFLFISIVALFRRKYIIKNNINSQHYYNAFAIALILLPMSWINPSLLRIVMYFSIFMLLFIPEIINSFQYISKNFKGDVTKFAMIILIALFLKSSLNSELKYGFFWQEMRLSKTYFIWD